MPAPLILSMEDSVPPITLEEYENLGELMKVFCKVPLLAEFSRPVALLHPEVRIHTILFRTLIACIGGVLWDDEFELRCAWNSLVSRTLLFHCPLSFACGCSYLYVCTYIL